MSKRSPLPLWLACVATPVLGCGSMRGAVPEPIWETPERLTGDCRGALDRARELRRQLKAAEPARRKSEQTLRLMNRLLSEIETASSWAGLLFNVHPDAPVREAAKQCQQEAERLSTEVMLDRGLYDGVAAVDVAGPDADARRFVERLLRDFRRAGVDRDEATRKRLADIKRQLTELKQQFRANINNDKVELELDGPSKLAGMPKDFLERHKPNAEGKVVVSTQAPDFFPIQTYCDDAAVRRELYQAYVRRAVEPNPPLLREVLELRGEYARLLDHSSWAAYAAEDKMVKSAETVDRFIRDVVATARPRMQRDLAEILERKRRDDSDATTVEAWDRFYYMRKVREEKHRFDAGAVRSYFAYEVVKDGVLALFSRLFGVRFERVDRAPVWHPSVELWAMRPATGDETLAVFFLDMHPRDGKYGHAAMFSPQTGVIGGPIPIGALVTNFPAPSDDGKPALMEHRQVLTLLHEFGHLVHHLFARKSRWVGVAGINVEWDFVEVPSQLMEEWGWDAEVLASFARDADGQPIPAELVASMRAAEEFGKGVEVMRQMFYAAYSFRIHARDPKSLDLEAFTDELYRDVSPFPRIDGGKIYASFEHLMGYSSMYYTYMWSLSLAKDIFTRFERDGLMNTETARELRDIILARGGAVDADAMAREFLGRAPDLKAFRRWLEASAKEP